MARFVPPLPKIASAFALIVLLCGLAAPGLALAQTPAPTIAPTTPPPITTPSPATDEAVPSTPAPTARPFNPIAPNPAVPIPGVTFGGATEANGKISIPYLAQYISGIYRLSVGLGSILAAIMIVYGGFRYMLSASLSDIKDGKTIIQDAFIGLVVLLSSFLILKTINPALVEMNPIVVDRITEQAPMVQGNAFTGLVGQDGTNSYGSTQGQCGRVDGASGSGNRVTYDGVAFYQLPMRGNYRQWDAPWGALEYGPGLSTNSPINPCKHPTHEGGVTTYSPERCVTTFAIAGCAATSFAEVLAYHGVQIADPGSAQIAANARIWNGDSLVPLAQHPRGSRIIQALQARTQLHLYDPLDAGEKAVRDHSRGSGNRGTGAGFMNYEGFTTTPITGSAAARATQVTEAIRSGFPVLFLCGGCTMKYRHINEADHTGGDHYMVFDGVSEDGNWFHVAYDGEGGGSGGRFIAASNMATHLDLYLIKPNAGTITHSCNTSNDGPVRGGGTPSDAADVAQRGTSGEVAHTGFFYSPTGGGDGWQESSPSQLLFPRRLGTAFSGSTGTARPRVHLYIFIHGLNSHGTTASQSYDDSGSWARSIMTAMNQVVGTKNIVVAAPYYVNGGDGSGRSYMNRFNLTSFYADAVRAMSTSMSGFQESDIADIVIGGHSAATCQGPGSPVLKQAISLPSGGTLGGHRILGVVLYDGCASDSVLNSRNFVTPPGVSLLFNPDFHSISDGMGIHSTDATPPVFIRARYADIRTQWGLPRMACPDYVENQCPMTVPPVEPSAPRYDQRRCNACYGKTVDGKQIVSFETTYGHRASVLHMTKYAFGAFYGQ